MPVVIDACIDPRLVEAFPDHQGETLFDLEWQRLKDHELVRKLNCDVFITADSRIEHEADGRGWQCGSRLRSGWGLTAFRLS